MPFLDHHIHVMKLSDLIKPYTGLGVPAPILTFPVVKLPGLRYMSDRYHFLFGGKFIIRLTLEMYPAQACCVMMDV